MNHYLEEQEVATCTRCEEEHPLEQMFTGAGGAPFCQWCDLTLDAKKRRFVRNRDLVETMKSITTMGIKL